MLRQVRIEFRGERHHVICRGVRREEVFWDEGGRTLCDGKRGEPRPLEEGE